jgi:hypothetical protein
MAKATCVHSTPPTNTSQICDQMRAAIGEWLRCPPDRRPSSRALGLRIAEIAASIEDRQ